MRRIYTETQIYPATEIFDLLIAICSQKRTGNLTINFAGGKPDGTAEWKQKINEGDLKKC